MVTAFNYFWPLRSELHFSQKASSCLSGAWSFWLWLILIVVFLGRLPAWRQRGRQRRWGCGYEEWAEVVQGRRVGRP